jgi:potassium-transporting ATPase KdpC subunit
MRIMTKVPKSLTFLLAMTLLVGVIYPVFITGIAQLAFPRKANGSLVLREGQVKGSTLLAQGFASPRYFKARPSATDYAYVGAGGSNLGPTSGALAKEVADRRAAWEAAFGSPAPEDMLYASASGLDPDISLEAALAQAPSVAAARGLGAQARDLLVERIRASAKDSGSLIAPPRINVVSLNALMDEAPEFAGTGR